jgi:3-hydroxy-D-aspartate aldolase
MNDDQRLHRSLVGRGGVRDQLNTPVLVIDREALDRNIARMAACARAHNVALRPHAKTHKSVEIAQRQLAAGAIGLCCAKLGEAEALVDQLPETWSLGEESVIASAGSNVRWINGRPASVLITSPVVSAPAIRRLVELHRRAELLVIIDHPDNASALAAALEKTDEPLAVLVDIDPGIRRTGVASPEAALALARQVRGLGQLVLRGIQMYCGMQQHIAKFADRQTAIRDRTSYLQSVIRLLADNQITPEIVTGSGTGSHRIDAELGLFTEWQVGSYVFMDRQYADCDLTGDGTAAFEYALFVEAQVVSCNHRGMATIDAGFKALATDGGAPVIVEGAPAGAMYVFMGDEHGAVIDPTTSHTWRIGDRVRLAVPHCDPTVNLYDNYHVVAGDTLEAIWPVTARGRSR